MTDIVTLNDITQDQFKAAERVIIDLIRSAYPALDLRTGGVIRETTVRPAATASALDIARGEQIQSLTSLARMVASGNATAEQMNAVLGNYGVTMQAGTKASGLVKVRVNSARTYTVPAQTQFRTLDGIAFAVGTTVTAKADPGESEFALLQASNGGYYFVVPVTAVVAGSTANIGVGTSLACTASIYDYIASEAFSSFSGGSDGESPAQAVSRIPAALSHRGLTNRTAIEAQLRANFEGSGISISAVSVQGMGDSAQLRDKHNVFGVAVGGRADVYVRTFTAPPVVTLIKVGTRTAPNTYVFDVDAADAPGFSCIRSVTEADGLGLGSYAITETHLAQGLDGTWHDITAAETAFTVYQGMQVTVSDVPYDSATHTFKVEVYAAPGIAAMQAYVDSDAVRNVAADFIVRGPAICRVGVSANVYFSAAAPVDLEGLKLLVAGYVNSRSFCPRLTRSELVPILLAAGVTRVELSSQGLQLQGRVVDAAGNVHWLGGDSLDIEAAQAPQALFTPATTVFVAELQDIHFNGITE